MNAACVRSTDIDLSPSDKRLFTLILTLSLIVSAELIATLVLVVAAVTDDCDDTMTSNEPTCDA